MAIKVKVPYDKKRKRFYVDYYTQGIRKRKFFRFENPAIDFKREQLCRKETPNYISRRTFEEACDLFSQTYLQGKSKNYANKEPRRLKHLVSFGFAGRLLCDITPGDIIEFRSKRLAGFKGPQASAHPASEKTVNNDLAILGSLFDWAIKNKMAESNPTKGLLISHPRPRRIRKARSPDQIQAVIQELCPCHKDEILLIANTGLRKGEMEQLRYPDHFDFENHVIDFRWQEGVEIKGKADRLIPMNDWVERYARRLQPGPAFGGVYYTLYWHFKHACKRAGVDMTIHELRHTYCTELQNSGVDPKTTMKIMGHKDMKTTLLYSHTEKNRLAAVRNAVTFQCHENDMKQDDANDTVQDGLSNLVSFQRNEENHAKNKVPRGGFEPSRNSPTLAEAHSIFSSGHVLVTPPEEAFLRSLEEEVTHAGM